MSLKVTKRDIILISCFLIIIMGVIYYFYFYGPKKQELENAKLNLESLVMQEEAIKAKIDSEPMLDERIKELESSIKGYSDEYYAEIKQENEIITIQELYQDSAINIDNMSFSIGETKLSQLALEALSAMNISVDEVSTAEGENTQNAEVSGEESEKIKVLQDAANASSDGENKLDQDVMSLVTNLQYKGSFDGLEKLMSNIYAHPKHIIMENMNLSSDGNGELSGNISIQMYGLPKISELFALEDRIYYEGTSKRASNADVYTPYETFVRPIEHVDSNVYDGVYGKHIDPFAVAEGEIAKTVYSFEGNDYFFAPGSDVVDGSVNKSLTAKHGRYSAKLSYQFLDKSGENIANLVFDKNPVIINESPDRLEMFVFMPKKSVKKNKLCAALVDKFSQEFIVEFNIQEVNENDKVSKWGIAKADLPAGISAPFAVERIFVKGEGNVQSLSGSWSFDNMRIVIANEVDADDDGDTIVDGRDQE